MSLTFEAGVKLLTEGTLSWLPFLCAPPWRSGVEAIVASTPERHEESRQERRES